MSEEAKIRRDLERALGPLPNTVWEDLIEDEYIRMYLEGHLEDDPEASWEFLKVLGTEAETTCGEARLRGSEAEDTH